MIEVNINPQQIMQLAVQIQNRLQEKNIELNENTATIINETLLQQQISHLKPLMERLFIVKSVIPSIPATAT